MKHLILIPIFAPLVIAACVPINPPSCGLPNEPVVISYTKSGFPIYDDQAALSVPCVVVTPPNVSTPPVDKPPVLPPVEPPEKVKGNNGYGNGDQDAPGGSEPNNGAENKGGNHNGKDEAPTDPILTRLVTMISEQTTLGQRLTEMRNASAEAERMILISTGGQNELWPLFLNGAEMSRQEAYDQNYHGIKDALDKLQGADTS